MTAQPALSPSELALLTGVFRAHPEVREVKLFGSRAKGTQTPHSDVDLAVFGNVGALQSEAMAAELDELPLPYHYDVKPFAAISLRALREHIERVGITIYSVGP
ncbi:nucleotidyltransferase domain-containing protein [soil metagenome]